MKVHQQNSMQLDPINSGPRKVQEDDTAIMAKIRSIVGRGNNAEVKGKKDGTLTVLEVKKNIV